MSKLVAIHQPNFFPWLGYFCKLARADVFVMLDHVQFPKTKGNWSNRVQLLIGQKPRYVTMPICRDYQGVRRVNEMLVSSQGAWREDMVKTVRTNYGRAAHFSEVFSWVEPLILNPTNNLSAYNLNAIRCLAQNLQIDTDKIVLSSILGVQSHSTDLLIEVVRAVGGDQYLNGGGASGYLEPEKFPAAGLGLVLQSFQHPIYPQMGGAEFVPGLSCLDALFNCGFKTVAGWLNGATPPKAFVGNKAA